MNLCDDSLKTIILHGELGEKFGREHKLVISTAQGACRALSLMIPGFRQFAVGDNNEKKYRVIRGDVDTGLVLDKDTIGSFNIGDAELHIVPVIAGSKSRGIGKIIFGALLFGVGALMGFGASGFALTGTAATTGVTVARLGVGVALSGISQMLSPSPGSMSSESPDKRESFLFNGPVNRSEQGNPVPLVYGLFVTGSVTVSAGLSTEDVIIDNE